MWLYPENATLRWDNGQDFIIIQLKSETLARWTMPLATGLFCSHAELRIREGVYKLGRLA